MRIDRHIFWQKDRILTRYVPKVLKPRLHYDLNCFSDMSFGSFIFVLSIQKKRFMLNSLYCSNGEIVNIMLEQLVLAIDPIMVEKESVILTAD